MKYNDLNTPLQCFINQSNWLKGALKNGKPVGILWHDTAAGNTSIGRYVQPDDDAKDKDYWINLLGENKYKNDWNHIDRNTGVNAFIGKLANGEVTTVQIGPWTTHPWGCGSGDLGSCNGYIKKNGTSAWTDQMWIQFECCDDGYKDGKGTKEYFDKVYKEACELTAYLCKKFDIDPKGTVDYNGAKVPTILCHKDSYELKLGNDHSDTRKWFKLYGKTMDDVRNDVATILAADRKVEKETYIVKNISTKKINSSFDDIAKAITKCKLLGYGYQVESNTGAVIYVEPYLTLTREQADKILAALGTYSNNTTAAYDTLYKVITNTIK